ncbi:hypothetical protein [Methanoculleus sp.]|uniref:hypothetical protein n=1 Tax=Methanoculleus sp. TaxID=90427 RepID=UPI0025D2B402|nr:hypothetical protein [Methanoculleus sp.]MCK9318920.1 hypothetical protein [Methanoculleus sp.]
MAIKKEKLICGKKEADIRKIYFSKKLPNFLTEIQANNKITEKELKDLVELLGKFRSEEKEITSKIAKEVGVEALGITEVAPPTIEELTTEMSEEEKTKFETWKAEVDKANETVKSIIREATQTAFAGKTVDREKWLDWGLTIANLSRYIDADRVYKDQLYRKRMIDIIDRYGVSRKEAEERSKITKEYADYKNAILFKDNLEEIIRICKKKGGYDY